MCVILTGSSADDESDEGSSSSRHKNPDMMETNVLSSAESGVVHDLDHETEDAMLEFTSGMFVVLHVRNTTFSNVLLCSFNNCRLIFLLLCQSVC